MAMSHNARITYIIDGNNYVCEERNVSKPSCVQLSNFITKIDVWLRKEIERNHEGTEAIIVFDPGAQNCDLSSDYASIEIAPHGEKADKSILRIARRLRNQDPKQKVIIISNDERDEFAILTGEKFEKKGNSYLTALFSSRFVKDPEFVKENIDPTENIGEFEELFGMDQKDHNTKKEINRENDYTYYEHILRLSNSSSAVRLNAVASLRHFPNDWVVSKLNELLEKESDLKVRRRALVVLLEIASKHEIDQQCKWRLQDTLDKMLIRETDSEAKEAAIKLRDSLYWY